MERDVYDNLELTEQGISIHALRMERDRESHKILRCPLAISIHALRMERDAAAGRDALRFCISIHALRMERDQAFSTSPLNGHHFNPRAPHGARRTYIQSMHYASDFNPRAPHGARPMVYFQPTPQGPFQSTRSAWSATSF